MKMKNYYLFTFRDHFKEKNWFKTIDAESETEAENKCKELFADEYEFLESTEFYGYKFIITRLTENGNERITKVISNTFEELKLILRDDVDDLSKITKIEIEL
jgi:hypothetical protein